MEANEIKKSCFEIKFTVKWGMPQYIYVISENMEAACTYARSVKNRQQEIEFCRCLGPAP